MRFSVLACVIVLSIVATGCGPGFASLPGHALDAQGFPQKPVETASADGVKQPGHVSERTDQFNADAPLVLLVPGFFNSLLLGYTRSGTSGIESEPYFSQAIIETVEAKGYPVAVVNTLEPVSRIEPNGELLLTFIRDLRARRPDLAHRRIVMIGHSAGGLYSMYALNKDRTLPVDALVTIGTPFQGADLVERIRNFAPVLETLAEWVSLQSLVELRPQRVAEFMKKIVLPTGLRVIVTGGSQKGCFLLSCSKAENLSWLMTLTGKIVGQPSDGVISTRSAFARDIDLHDALGDNVIIERPKGLRFDLEHWEQVHDYRLFYALGIKNVGKIEREQREFYSEALDYVARPRP